MELGRPSALTLACMTVAVLILDGLLFLRFGRERRFLPALKQRFEAQSRPPARVGSLTSYTADGRRVLESLPDNVRVIVVSVLHDGREQEEAKVWEEVIAAVADPRFLFIGCCENRQCVTRPSRPPWTIVVDVPFMLARTLASYGARGYFIVLDRTLSVTHHLHWDSAAQMSAQLRTIRDEAVTQ